MPKDTKTLGYIKAPACESRGFVNIKRGRVVLTHPQLNGIGLQIRRDNKQVKPHTDDTENTEGTSLRPCCLPDEDTRNNDNDNCYPRCSTERPFAGQSKDNLSSYRTPGDIDIWLHGSRKDILRYVRKHVPDCKPVYHHVDFPVVDGVEIEVHFTPSWMNSPVTNRRLQRFFRENAGALFVKNSVTSDLQSEVEGKRGFTNPQLNGIGLQIQRDNKQVKPHTDDTENTEGTSLRPCCLSDEDTRNNDNNNCYPLPPTLNSKH